MKLFLYSQLTIMILRFKDIYIPFGSIIEKGTIIGRYTRINNKSFLQKCQIGNFCAIAGNLIVRSKNHDVNYLNLNQWAQKNIFKSKKNVDGVSKGKVVIGHNVWIGDRVTILDNVKIGDGAVIGAGSVVTKDIESYSISAGVPAKHIRFRFEKNTREALKKLDWDKITKNNSHEFRDIFEIDITKDSKVLFEKLKFHSKC